MLRVFGYFSSYRYRMLLAGENDQNLQVNVFVNTS